MTEYASTKPGVKTAHVAMFFGETTCCPLLMSTLFRMPPARVCFLGKGHPKPVCFTPMPKTSPSLFQALVAGHTTSDAVDTPM